MFNGSRPYKPNVSEKPMDSQYPNSPQQKSTTVLKLLNKEGEVWIWTERWLLADGDVGDLISWDHRRWWSCAYSRVWVLAVLLLYPDQCWHKFQQGEKGQKVEERGQNSLVLDLQLAVSLCCPLLLKLLWVVALTKGSPLVQCLSPDRAPHLHL